MTDDDRAARSHLEELREKMEGKSPLEAIRDDMDELTPQFTDAVGNEDTTTQPSLDDEPGVDEGDDGRALPADRPSERTEAGRNRT